MDTGTLLINPTAVRSIAMNAGDLSVAVMREVTRIMGENGNSQVKSLQRGIDRLLEDGNISDEEAQDLMTISRLVLGATRDKSDVSKAAAEVHQLYHRMVITGKSTLSRSPSVVRRMRRFPFRQSAESPQASPLR